ncbi:MAG: MATE family efflux transporter, partial [Candidatus Marinimicrobia bacterium]|nr:MATE family efflux transporter [Candidatus Neomarinimicrobiota bacterium]
FGYGLYGVLMLSTSVLNVLNKPIHATILTVTQMFILYIPMAFIGSYFFGIQGIFIALALSYFVSGIVAHIVQGKIMAIEERIM